MNSEWKVQLGSGYDKLSLNKNECFFLSKKLNGNRCSYFGGQLVSRQGRVFSGMQHIINDIVALGLSDCFIDGELIRKNVNNVADGENFRIGNGIINSGAGSKEEIQFVVFDMFPAVEFNMGESNCTYAQRKQKLLCLDRRITGADISNVCVVQMVYEGTDSKQIDSWLKYAESHDWEGLMLNKDCKYKCGRTTNLIKIKQFHTVDLEIVDMVEGAGRLQDTLGALIVRYKNNVINVGTGFDDWQRDELWRARHSLPGRIAEVKYKEESSNKRTGLKSLQFPTFVCIREPGKQVSYEA